MNHISTPRNLRSGRLVGIGFMLLGVFLFSINDVLGKLLVATYSVGQILLLRSIAALSVLLPLMYLNGAPFIKWKQPRIHVLRLVLSTLEVACFYWAVTYLPLADVMIFYLAGPIYVAAFAVLWLGETLNLQRVMAIGVGFVGVLLILYTSSATVTAPALIALSGSIFYALFMITTRKLRETSDATLLLGQIAGTLIFGVVAAPLAWTTPRPVDLAGLFLLGIVSMAGHACVNRSLKIAPASVVAPYQYSLIVWAIVLGYVFFGDIIGLSTLIGAVIICLSGLGLFILEREAASSGGKVKDIETPVLPEG